MYNVHNLTAHKVGRYGHGVTTLYGEMLKSGQLLIASITYVLSIYTAMIMHAPSLSIGQTTKLHTPVGERERERERERELYTSYIHKYSLVLCKGSSILRVQVHIYIT